MARSRNARPAYLGLDVGTSAVKALLVDEDGARIATAAERIPLTAVLPLQAEQEAEDWWRATCTVVRRVLDEAGDVALRAVGLTGQKHALLGIDEAGTPVAPALLWADGRARAQARHVRETFPAAGRRVGQHALPGLFLPKWLYLRDTNPEAAARIRTFLFAKDYVRWRLTGDTCTDWTEASASQLFDFRRNTWSTTLGAYFDLAPSALPRVAAPGAEAGRVHAEARAATGIPVGTPVAAGAGDNEAAALAVGAIGEGRVAVTLGTSGTLVGWNKLRSSAGGLVWNRHVLRAGYAATGTVLSAGRALRWYRDLAYPAGTQVAEMLAEAEAAPASPAPLVFLPSLVGERSPVADPGATGAFVGLRAVHGRTDLARAVLESISLSMAEVLVLMRGAGVQVDELRVTGGGAASAWWRRLIAAATNTPVRQAGHVDGPARGAALLGAVLDGAGDPTSRSEAWARPGPLEAPDPEVAERLLPLGTLLRATRNALRGVRTR